MYYLSGIAKELEAVLENQEDQVLQHHPRYSALCESEHLNLPEMIPSQLTHSNASVRSTHHQPTHNKSELPLSTPNPILIHLLEIIESTRPSPYIDDKGPPFTSQFRHLPPQRNCGETLWFETKSDQADLGDRGVGSRVRV